MSFNDVFIGTLVESCIEELDFGDIIQIRITTDDGDDIIPELFTFEAKGAY